MSKEFQATDTGRVRSHNEDCCGIFAPACYVVADGMGGHAAGEVASGMLLDTVRTCLEGRSGLGEEELRQAVIEANRRICETAKASAALSGMGTTATLLHVDAGKGAGYWAHVGDSRLYLMRAGVLTQITRDHSYVEDLVAQGEITEEEARRHPQRNMLTRAVGVEELVEVDTGCVNLQMGDVLLLSTDGLTNMVTDEAICTMLCEAREDPAKTLVSRAVENGGIDNVTAVVAEYAP